MVATTSIPFETAPKVAAVGHANKTGGAAVGRASAFVVSVVEATNRPRLVFFSIPCSNYTKNESVTLITTFALRLLGLDVWYVGRALAHWRFSGRAKLQSVFLKVLKGGPNYMLCSLVGRRKLHDVPPRTTRGGPKLQAASLRSLKRPSP